MQKLRNWLQRKRDFVWSWNIFEDWFKELSEMRGWDYIVPLLFLMREIRDKGYDSKLRAGQSMHALVLSRSRHHHMSAICPCIRILVQNDGSMKVSSFIIDDENDYHYDKIELNNELIYLLDKLVSQPIHA